MMLHLLIMMAGRWIIRFSSGKIDAIQEGCKKHYDKFRYDMYRKNGIMQNSENGRDEICFESENGVKKSIRCSNILIRIMRNEE